MTKTVKFYDGKNLLTGIVREMYLGPCEVATQSPEGYGFTNISISYYIVEAEDNFFHVRCESIVSIKIE